MKSFVAHFLFPANLAPIPKGIVEVDESGKILKIVDPQNNLSEKAGMEFHNGIICPGLINPFDLISIDDFFSSFPSLIRFRNVLKKQPQNENDLLDWMRLIQMEDSSFSLEELIRIFSLETSKLIGSQKETGSIESGKTPGLRLISQMDYHKLKLTENSRIKKLI